FDADDHSIFDRQYEFIVQSGIVVASIALLLALPHTPLHARLERAGRLRPHTGDQHRLWNNLISTNVMPLQMTDDELIAGFRDLIARLTSDEAIAERIRNKVRDLGRTPRAFGHTCTQSMRYLTRFLLHGVIRGGPGRWVAVARSLGPVARRPR